MVREARRKALKAAVGEPSREKRALPIMASSSTGRLLKPVETCSSTRDESCLVLFVAIGTGNAEGPTSSMKAISTVQVDFSLDLSKASRRTWDVAIAVDDAHLRTKASKTYVDWNALFMAEVSWVVC
ncbi:hypothetical protein B0A48_06488 [Cryoendolithus antarcticus]|uniref:Uncharacterized protein n=1 Tax=Cryoendolithus antarcticus TaxID=1507870 RepID=A0A1V8TBK0_9PEZI|nr:hypothetical protein B0A48_06488 [Cryoendolithus antarcticus]